MSKDFNLETAMQNLEKLESYFQQPNIDIDEAIAKHTEALKAAQEIITYLQKAEQTLERLDIATLVMSDEVV
jgi:exonuclease VII small subunit